MIVEVLIQNIQDKIDITKNIENIMENAVEFCLVHEKIEKPSEVSILLVDDEKIREINNEQRGIDSSTDVLSFPIVEMEDGEIKSNLGDIDMEENIMLLGDIVISLETAYKQANEYGHSFERELAFLTTHGVFHLLGYDHEDKESEKNMLNKQEVVLGKMGLKRQDYEEDEILDCEILVRKAIEEKEKAYAPYSGFKVGAAVLTETGNIYTGVNIENVSFSATNCAERTAVFKAISNGERKIRAIAISSDSEEIVFPCGICRQVILEFGNKNTKIICSNNNGDYKVYNLEELLPYAFKKIN
ncbi:MAG TPA: rRNA maturation RNase YbeY [Clostridiaceae bacterium]|jgi:probable rRNA maturation factor|nr:rRNA maturation RNase YbeY [Clostridiaceae bacterium]